MPATLGFTSNKRPHVFVHPTHAPDPTNTAAIGSIWIQVNHILIGPPAPATFVATSQGAGGTTTVWTAVT